VKPGLLAVSKFLPNVELLKRNGVRVFIAVGIRSQERKMWYDQADQMPTEQRSCQLVTFPGRHGSYVDLPRQWAAALRSVLRTAGAVTQREMNSRRILAKVLP
jgi:hypothetical protein